MKKIPNWAYEYNRSFSAILSGFYLFVFCAAVSSSVARLNRGLTIGSVTLSPHAATVLWWVFFALSLLGALLLLILLGVRRLRQPERVVLTPDAIIVPRSWWSSGTISIPYASIRAVRKTTALGREFLKITHREGESEIAASSLAHKAFLDDIRIKVTRRMERLNPMTQKALEQITERANRNGDVNDPATPRPLLTLAEFFEGNHVIGSIGCNLSSPPKPSEFYEILKRIAARPEVRDVRVEITTFDDPEWPYSDSVWIITSAEPGEVAAWFDESVRPDECRAGWTDGVSFEPCDVPQGMTPVACWWD